MTRRDRGQRGSSFGGPSDEAHAPHVLVEAELDEAAAEKLEFERVKAQAEALLTEVGDLDHDQTYQDADGSLVDLNEFDTVYDQAEEALRGAQTAVAINNTVILPLVRIAMRLGLRLTSLEAAGPVPEQTPVPEEALDPLVVEYASMSLREAQGWIEEAAKLASGGDANPVEVFEAQPNKDAKLKFAALCRYKVEHAGEPEPERSARASYYASEAEKWLAKQAALDERGSREKDIRKGVRERAEKAREKAAREQEAVVPDIAAVCGKAGEIVARLKDHLRSSDRTHFDSGTMSYPETLREALFLSFLEANPQKKGAADYFADQAMKKLRGQVPVARRNKASALAAIKEDFSDSEGRMNALVPFVQKSVLTTGDFASVKRPIHRYRALVQKFVDEKYNVSNEDALPAEAKKILEKEFKKVAPATNDALRDVFLFTALDLDDYEFAVAESSQKVTAKNEAPPVPSAAGEKGAKQENGREEKVKNAEAWANEHAQEAEHLRVAACVLKKTGSEDAARHLFEVGLDFSALKAADPRVDLFLQSLASVRDLKGFYRSAIVASENLVLERKEQTRTINREARLAWANEHPREAEQLRDGIRLFKDSKQLTEHLVEVGIDLKALMQADPRVELFLQSIPGFKKSAQLDRAIGFASVQLEKERKAAARQAPLKADIAKPAASVLEVTDEEFAQMALVAKERGKANFKLERFRALPLGEQLYARAFWAFVAANDLHPATNADDKRRAGEAAAKEQDALMARSNTLAGASEPEPVTSAPEPAPPLVATGDTLNQSREALVSESLGWVEKFDGEYQDLALMAKLDLKNRSADDRVYFGAFCRVILESERIVGRKLDPHIEADKNEALEYVDKVMDARFRDYKLVQGYHNRKRRTLRGIELNAPENVIFRATDAAHIEPYLLAVAAYFKKHNIPSSEEFDALREKIGELRRKKADPKDLLAAFNSGFRAMLLESSESFLDALRAALQEVAPTPAPVVETPAKPAVEKVSWAETHPDEAKVLSDAVTVYTRHGADRLRDFARETNFDFNALRSADDGVIGVLPGLLGDRDRKKVGALLAALVSASKAAGEWSPVVEMMPVPKIEAADFLLTLSLDEQTEVNFLRGEVDAMSTPAEMHQKLLLDFTDEGAYGPNILRYFQLAFPDICPTNDQLTEATRLVQNVPRTATKFKNTRPVKPPPIRVPEHPRDTAPAESSPIEVPPLATPFPVPELADPLQQPEIERQAAYAVFEAKLRVAVFKLHDFQTLLASRSDRAELERLHGARLAAFEGLLREVGRRALTAPAEELNHFNGPELVMNGLDRLAGQLPPLEPPPEPISPNIAEPPQEPPSGFQRLVGGVAKLFGS